MCHSQGGGAVSTPFGLMSVGCIHLDVGLMAHNGITVVMGLGFWFGNGLPDNTDACISVIAVHGGHVW